MEPTAIRALVEAFTVKSSFGNEPGYKEIKALGEEVIPYFLEQYPKSSRWEQRVAYVYHSIRPAANGNKTAFQLGLLALKDKSKHVRYRACMLLACAQDIEALPYLEALRDHPVSETKKDVEAAIDALKSKNHHYFIDRSHSNKMFLNVE
jgi:hypothetical protein